MTERGMERCERWRSIKITNHQKFIFWIRYNFIILTNKFQITSLSQIMTIKEKFQSISSVSALKWTIFLVSPYLANTNKLDGLSTWEHATYNCPCEKHGVPKSKPQTDIVWPWDLLIVIANANLIGNWTRLNSIGISVGIIGIRGSNTSSPRNFPFKMLASTTFFINFLMCHCTAVVGSNYEAK